MRQAENHSSAAKTQSRRSSGLRFQSHQPPQEESPTPEAHPVCHQPLLMPFALPTTLSRICSPIPQEDHPGLPFPAPGDFSEVYCSHGVWVKGSQGPTHGGRPAQPRQALAYTIRSLSVEATRDRGHTCEGTAAPVLISPLYHQDPVSASSGSWLPHAGVARLPPSQLPGGEESFYKRSR